MKTLLIILGAPLWIPLIVAAFAIVFSLFLVFWVLAVSFWAVFVSLAAGAVGGIVSAIILIFTGSGLTGAALIGLSLVACGLSIFWFFICKGLTKAAVYVTQSALWKLRFH